jgi:hypothetical protein
MRDRRVKINEQMFTGSLPVIRTTVTGERSSALWLMLVIRSVCEYRVTLKFHSYDLAARIYGARSLLEPSLHDRV